MYTRYEVVNKDNTYNCGLLTCLDDINLDIDTIESLTENFDAYLPRPSFYDTKGKNKRKDVFSYFTELGLNRFKEDIERICKVVEEKGYDVIIKKQDKVGSARLVYCDKYQALIRRK